MMTMKLMTINTHSLIEPEHERKLRAFVEKVCAERPDILALQEVNQLADEKTLEDEALLGFVRCPGFTIPVRYGNHAARLAELLRERGLSYHWTWVSAKLGYDKYDEGLALFSLCQIAESEQFLISGSSDYSCWKTRRIIGIRPEGMPDTWFYSVHMGWWDDEVEPFKRQWRNLNTELSGRGRMDGTVWMLGDFNSPSGVRGQSYDCICGSGWKDSYELAVEKDSGVTVEEVIDGWRNRTDGENASRGMRLDFLFCNRAVSVDSSRVFCNGQNGPVVSDHYGVVIETGSDELQ